MSEAENQKITIAVDAMGGDFGPSITIHALSLAIQKNPNLHFLVFGDAEKIKPIASQYNLSGQSVEIIHSEKMIGSADKPSAALRASKGTSMRMAIEAVESGKAQAIVSAGNTGALMALAKIVLRPMTGIYRPAIASVLPGIKGDTVMLDLGANVLVDAENLVQFALLGAIFAKAYKKIDFPTVGLLNIGSEDVKGPDHVRAASEILSKINFPGKYIGFVEGDDIGKGGVDVIVSDGYAGNIALKTMEGAGKLIKHYMIDSFSSNFMAKVGAFFAYSSLKRLKNKMDPRLYNGGVFLGLNGLCIKSHGGTDAIGFCSAIMVADRLARSGYIDHVAKDIAKLSEQDSYIASAQDI